VLLLLLKKRSRRLLPPKMKNRSVCFESFPTRRQGKLVPGVDFVLRECKKKKKKRLHQQQAKAIVLKAATTATTVDSSHHVLALAAPSTSTFPVCDNGSFMPFHHRTTPRPFVAFAPFDTHYHHLLLGGCVRFEKGRCSSANGWRQGPFIDP
jgi:hypothetical protein